MPRLICLAVLGTMLATRGLGQTTFATLTGAVTDPNGSVIPGAIVEVTQSGSNYRYTAKSNEAGIYTLGQLREGVYTLTRSEEHTSELQSRPHLVCRLLLEKKKKKKKIDRKITDATT